MRRTIPVLLLALVVVLAACGGDDSDDDASGTPPTDPPADVDDGVDVVAALPSDACALLSDDDVEAAIGTADAGTPATPREDGGRAVLVGCTWGAVASDDPALAVQVGVPSGEARINYLKTLTNAASQSSEPIDIGENGQLLGTGFLPGGGGVGQSVIFEKDGQTVVVGLIRCEQEKLEAAAEAVEANL
jgi:hypothetical protein